jgi:uncharacterized protein
MPGWPAEGRPFHDLGASRATFARHQPGSWNNGPGCDDGCVSDESQVTDNQAESRLELEADGHVAELEYRRNGKRLVLIHTEVPTELEGRGLGGRLVTAAVERAQRDGMTVVPLCPFARGWLERHPDVAAQVEVDWR